MSASYLLAAMLLAIAPAASKPDVRLGLGTQPEFSNEGVVRLPVVIGPLGAESVAALQFDLLFETSQLRFNAVEPGPSALGGSKSTHANPLKPGTVRIIVAGLNRNSLADGVVAWALFSPAPGPLSPYTVRLSGVVLSDPYGTAVDAHAAPDTLSLDPVAAIALASDSGVDQRGASTGEYLMRYRALLLAVLFIGGAACFARRTPRKGRAR